MTKPHTPTSYEEITRATSPALDVFQPPPSTPSLGERELVERVQWALHADPRLASTEIDVIAHGSQIWLAGTVLGPGMAAYATDVVARVAGVTEVHNELVIRWR